MEPVAIDALERLPVLVEITTAIFFNLGRIRGISGIRHNFLGDRSSPEWPREFGLTPRSGGGVNQHTI